MNFLIFHRLSSLMLWVHVLGLWQCTLVNEHDGDDDD